jgi:hypothetical protein
MRVTRPGHRNIYLLCDSQRFALNNRQPLPRTFAFKVRGLIDEAHKAFCANLLSVYICLFHFRWQRQRSN